MVSNATLHNQDEIDRKILELETLLLSIALDVIPEVIKVVQEKRLIMPKNIYYLIFVLHVIVKQAGIWDAVLRCTNMENCPDQIKGQIKHFVSKNGLDIDGVGDKLIDSLVDQKIIFHIVIF